MFSNLHITFSVLFIWNYNGRPDQYGQSPYPFSGQNGEKNTPFGAAQAYMAYIRKYPPGWPTCSRTLPPTEEKRGKGLATRRLPPWLAQCKQVFVYYTGAIWYSVDMPLPTHKTHGCLVDLFTDTAAILKLNLKSIIGCPGCMSTTRYTLSVFTRAFRANFFSVFLEKDCNGKKDRWAVFGCNNDRLFPEKYTLKFPFCPKSARKF